jgi:hypothetical protein
MIGLSTKLQERMVLNTGGTFPEFVSNIMITNDAIHAHKETKKRKAIVAPDGVPPRLHLPTPIAAAAPAPTSAAAVGSPPTSASAPAGNT